LILGGPLGRAIVVIVGAIAELERNLIVERVKAGMRRAKLEGRQIGRALLKIETASRRSANSPSSEPLKRGQTGRVLGLYSLNQKRRAKGDRPGTTNFAFGKQLWRGQPKPQSGDQRKGIVG